MNRKFVIVTVLVILCEGIALIGPETKPAYANPSPVIVDSHSETNEEGGHALSTADPTDNSGIFSAVGQSFNASVGAGLTSCKFYLAKSGHPTVNLTAYLYAHTGTYGTSSLPVGSPLAVSDQLNSSILAQSYALYQFNFTGTFALTIGTKYCIEISAWNSPGTMDIGNVVYVAHEYYTPTHAGSANHYAFSDWHTTFVDFIFYVYGNPLSPPVGGEWMPINTVQMLVQLAGSAAAMSAIAASFVSFKRIKKKQN